MCKKCGIGRLGVNNFWPHALVWMWLEKEDAGTHWFQSLAPFTGGFEGPPFETQPQVLRMCLISFFSDFWKVDMVLEVVTDARKLSA